MSRSFKVEVDTVHMLSVSDISFDLKIGGSGYLEYCLGNEVDLHNWLSANIDERDFIKEVDGYSPALNKNVSYRILMTVDEYLTFICDNPDSDRSKRFCNVLINQYYDKIEWND